MFSTLFILAVLFAVATAFSPARFAVRSRSMQMNAGWKPLDDPMEKSADGRCLKKDVDVKGRCPGDSGYKPPVGNAPSSFAEYQKALKEKKAAGN